MMGGYLFDEDDLRTFEGWLKYQAVDVGALSPEEAEQWRAWFDEAQKDAANKVGLMKIRAMPGEYRYAVAVRDDEELWLVLWIRRNIKRDVFVMVPRAKSGWDPHTSYHADGRLHEKSFGKKLISQQRQPLTGDFRGVEHLGAYGGHGPKTVGAICDASAFSGVLEVRKGILGPNGGAISVDLVEPDTEPLAWPLGDGEVFAAETFKDVEPWIVVRVGSTTGRAH